MRAILGAFPEGQVGAIIQAPYVLRFGPIGLGSGMGLVQKRLPLQRTPLQLGCGGSSSHVASVPTLVGFV